MSNSSLLLVVLSLLTLSYCANGQFGVRQVWDSISGTANGVWANVHPAVNTATHGLSAVSNLTHAVSNSTNHFVNSSTGVVQSVVGSTDLLAKPIVDTMNGTVNLVNEVVKPINASLS